MNALGLFTIEVALCFGISATVILLIKPLLQDVLIDICGTNKRAAFWVMFTQLMLIIAPLLFVIYFATTETPTEINLAETMKNTLFRSLLGNFIALAIIGQMIWKSINGTHAKTNADSEKHPIEEVQIK